MRQYSRLRGGPTTVDSIRAQNRDYPHDYTFPELCSVLWAGYASGTVVREPLRPACEAQVVRGIGLGLIRSHSEGDGVCTEVGVGR